MGAVVGGGGGEVEQFLSHLAEDRKVAASTRNQAMNALVFLYKRVLEHPLNQEGDGVHGHRQAG